MVTVLALAVAEKVEAGAARFAERHSERNYKMNTDEREDTTIYTVVVNHEEQYSIWPADREMPLGWRDAGKSGLKPDCLAYIKEVWTDMRPLSLRKKMEEDARKG